MKILRNVTKLLNSKNERKDKIMYVTNAFSLQMVKANSYTIKVNKIDSLPNNLESAIGHADTAAVLGYKPNRVSIELKKGDRLYVAQLMGGRLPEGATTLPEGFSFNFYCIYVE